MDDTVAGGTGHSLSLNELAVLAVLSESPAHGFAIAREFQAGSELGRILTIRRPLVYRALKRLAALEMARPTRTEPGSAGPRRVIYEATRTGRTFVRSWLQDPVDHIRDIRIVLLLKLALLGRAGLSYTRLVTAQREELRPTLLALDGGDPPLDPVDRWRRHVAIAAGSFLDELRELNE